MPASIERRTDAARASAKRCLPAVDWNTMARCSGNDDDCKCATAVVTVESSILISS